MKSFLSYLIVAVSFGVVPVSASGFGLYEQGVQGQGNAGAFVARAEDGSALYYNPAGLANLEFDEIAIGARSLSSKSFYSNAGQTTWRADRSQELSPLFFYNKQLGRFGLAAGLTTTFSHDVEWTQADYPGRFLANEGHFKVDELLLGFGYRLTDTFSAGITLRQARMETVTSKALPRPFLASNPGAFYEATETYSLDGDDLGFTAGLQYRRDRFFTIGLAYQSGIEIGLSGDRSYQQSSLLNDQRAVAAFQSTFNHVDPVTSSFELPDRITAGICMRMTVRTRLELDASRDGWSSTQATVFQIPGQADVVTLRNWDDSTTIRIAGDFQQRRALLWRAGIASATGIADSATVRPDFPDNDRFIYTFGVSYTMAKRYTLEGGWSLVQSRDRFVDDQELVFDPNDPDYTVSNGQRGLIESQNFSIQLGLRVRLGK